MNEIKKEVINRAYRESVSITHRHMLSIINTLIKNELFLKTKKVITILDAGCGEGELILFLHKYLPLTNHEVNFIMYGYDLLDHGVQREDFAEQSLKNLRANIPEVDWTDRIRFISATEAWPFEDGFFDIVISNQVLEHVWDHHQFFFQQTRVLREKGFATHIFPIKEVMVDGHIFLPAVHKLKSWDAIYRKVKFYSKLGLGLYRKEKHLYRNDVDFFSKVWADKIYHYCNYPSYAQISKAAKDNHLCITSRFTGQFYQRKFFEILGVKRKFSYRYTSSSKILFFFLKRISGVCFTMYKGEYSMYDKEDIDLTRKY